jgi:nucleotide-binding universal stress UspA family protein
VSIDSWRKDHIGGLMSFAESLNTILVATDLKGNSEAALEYARKLAVAYSARIVIAHGLDPLEFADVEAVPARIRRRMPEQARAAVDQMAADLIREGIHSHSEVRQGEVVEMLLEVAQQYHAGLIVVGTKGHQGAGPVAVGAIAEELVRRASCAVLAVAADWNAGEFRPTPGGPVMLAIEQNEAAPAAAEAACSLASVFKRTLIIVHARTAAESSAFLNPCSTSAAQFGIRETGEFPVRCVVKDGNPADAVNRAVLQYRPSILVTGGKRKSGSGGPHGTVFALLAASRAPVLCVPAGPSATAQPELQVAVQSS